MYLRSSPGKTKEAIAGLVKIFKSFNPEYPLEYQFMDDTFNEMYRSEQVMGKLAMIFTAFALFIALLGLLGLAIFAGQQRLKEISVRKVLGANLVQIVYLLSRDFIFLVLVAFVIAAPLAYLFIEDWLDKYAYKISPGIGVFVLAGGATLVITLCTVGFYSLKIAFINPVNNLRSE
jgi:ABC-type antimicrobial peptide transport system permease subunit